MNSERNGKASQLLGPKLDYMVVYGIGIKLNQIQTFELKYAGDYMLW